jgi:hypothetical protein
VSPWAKQSDSNQELPPELRQWFLAYRDAVPQVDAGPDFMPGLWAKIEARQRATALGFSRLARQFVTAACAICLGLSVMYMTPLSVGTRATPQTWVEVVDQNSVDPEVDLAAVSSEESL